ncbi:hypothetical protein IH981_03945 [Patescibacteria group bacterium]|nr:hypothetical protein [Patescibacteria group bacterium]
MFCKQCGKEIQDKGNFCQFCGYKFNDPVKTKESDTKTKSEETKKQNKFSLSGAVGFVIVLIILLQFFDGLIGVTIAGLLAGLTYGLISYFTTNSPTKNKNLKPYIAAGIIIVWLLIVLAGYWFFFISEKPKTISYAPKPPTKEEKAIKDCDSQARQSSGRELAKTTLKDPNASKEDKENAKIYLDIDIYIKYDPDTYGHYYKSCLRSKGID